MPNRLRAQKLLDVNQLKPGNQFYSTLYLESERQYGVALFELLEDQGWKLINVLPDTGKTRHARRKVVEAQGLTHAKGTLLGYVPYRHNPQKQTHSEIIHQHQQQARIEARQRAKPSKADIYARFCSFPIGKRFVRITEWMSILEPDASDYEYADDMNELIRRTPPYLRDDLFGDIPEDELDPQPIILDKGFNVQVLELADDRTFRLVESFKRKKLKYARQKADGLKERYSAEYLTSKTQQILAQFNPSLFAHLPYDDGEIKQLDNEVRNE